MQETQIQSLGWENPLEKGMQPAPVFLPGESHGQKTLVGYNSWGHEELDMAEHALLLFLQEEGHSETDNDESHMKTEAEIAPTSQGVTRMLAAASIPQSLPQTL